MDFKERYDIWVCLEMGYTMVHRKNASLMVKSMTSNGFLVFYVQTNPSIGGIDHRYLVDRFNYQQ